MGGRGVATTDRSDGATGAAGQGTPGMGGAADGSGSDRVSVLIVHDRYRQAGGEDAVVANEAELLRQRGHRVSELVVDNDRIVDGAGPLAKAKLAANTVWSFSAATAVTRRIERERPDVVHVHNVLPLLSPSVHAAARGAGAAVVQTVHNYRLVCPAGTLFRDGRPCEDCVGRRVAWPAVAHACYRSSRAQSAVVATMLAAHEARGTWDRDVDAFLTVSEFMRGRLIAGGLPADRIVVKSNFVEDRSAVEGASPARPGRRDGPLLFVGRLTGDKGVDLLLDAWSGSPDLPLLEVVGDGPLADEVAAVASSNGRVVPVGRLDPVAVRARMAAAPALVFPSRWYEGQPMTILEAYAAGLPVIAASIGSLPELVRDGETGLLFRAGDIGDLRRAVTWAMAHPADLRRMGERARALYEEQFTPDAGYAALVDAYRSAIASKERAHAG
jgi:glycosyltransferase involved in cell wall biosynthesis